MYYSERPYSHRMQLLIHFLSLEKLDHPTSHTSKKYKIISPCPV